MSVYACSDLHGDKKLFNEIKNIISPEDTVYFLGDAIDRGPDGWDILKEILNDSRFKMLCGNHEDFMLAANREYRLILKDYPSELEDDRYLIAYPFRIWFANGGQTTWDKMKDDPMREAICAKVQSLPLTFEYTNKHGTHICMSHSGAWDFNGWISRKDYLWDREHFNDEWYGEDDEIIVHGHTPNYFVEKTIYGVEPPSPATAAVYYCDGHKICIDCGTYWSGITTLINLDTLHQTIISTGDIDNG